MNKTDGFPKELLKQPWEKRLKFFHERKIIHGRMKTISDKIISAVHRRAGEGLIFVVGPTRIGKTTVLEYVISELLKESMDEMLKNPGCIPVAWMETRPYQRGYDWRDHWVSCLKAVKEPLIDYKIMQPHCQSGVSQNIRILPQETKTTTVARCAFEEAAKQRGTRVFCVDEAQHLTLVPYSKMYRAQLEIIKSVASHSKAMQLLFGTYDLLKLRNASGQLGSRTVTVHFSRYRPDRNNDLEDFAKAVLNLTTLMPLREPPDLTKEDLEYCFDTCLGCVGLLKVWLTDALGAALEKGERTLTRRHLEKNEPPIDVLDKISLEIVCGEKMLEQDESKRPLIKLRMLKGSKYKESDPSQHLPTERPDEAENQERSTGTDAATQKSTKKRAKKRKRVERNPKRDRTGGGRRKNAA
jgi:AAA domain